jgi:hypothetical protein
MSTGLTYVSFCDFDVSSNPVTTNFSFVFNSYDEAYSYGDWYVKNFCTNDSNQFVTLWTSGPNVSGYWQKQGGVSVWYNL